MDENEVVAAACARAEAEGYHIESSCRTTEKGTDVVARSKRGRELFVEAKGGTSSRPGSNRFGKPYNRSQVFDRVGKGIYTCMQLRARHGSRPRVVLAVPDSKLFHLYLDQVTSQVEAAGIEVWFLQKQRARG